VQAKIIIGCLNSILSKKIMKRRNFNIYEIMNIKHDWFLPIDLINHIKSLGEQISCFVWLERS